jgi:hypothetical protein
VKRGSGLTAQGTPHVISDAERRRVHGPLQSMHADSPWQYLRKAWRETPTFQRWICAYIVLGTIATISWSLAITEPPAAAPRRHAPTDAVNSHNSAVEAGAATGEGR